MDNDLLLLVAGYGVFFGAFAGLLIWTFVAQSILRKKLKDLEDKLQGDDSV